MNRHKTGVSFIVAIIISALLIGCGSGTGNGAGSSAASTAAQVSESGIENKEEFGTAYEMTAIFSVSNGAIENKPVLSTSDVVYPDITDCGVLNTFSEKYNIPEIKGDKAIEYFSPIICSSEVTEVKVVKDESDKEDLAVKETTVKVGDADVKAFVVQHAGTYEVTVGGETLPLTVKEGSLYLDVINEMAAANILINMESEDFIQRGKEYDTTVPALVKSYLDKYKDEASALAALKMDNGLFLKEYNRIRKLRGDKVLSAEEMVKEYKDYKINEEEIKKASNRRGFRDKIAALRKIDLSAEASETKKDNNNNTTANNTTKKNNNSSNNNSSNSNSNSTPAPVATGGGSGAEAMALINNYRAQYGLPPFAWYGEGVASIRAREIISNFSHNSASGQDCYGENICMEPTGTARKAVDLWINSPGHRANLLDKVCTKGAVAVAFDGEYYWWSMNIWK